MLYFEANRIIHGLLNAQKKAENFLNELAQEYWDLKIEKMQKKYKNRTDLVLSEFEIISTPQYETMKEIENLYSKIKEKAKLLDNLLKYDKDIVK